MMINAPAEMNLSAFMPYVRWVEDFTILLLLFLSIWSIGIMVQRRRLFREAARVEDATEVEDILSSGDESKLQTWAAEKKGLVAGLVRTLLEASPKPQAIEPAARSYLLRERAILEKGLGGLATLGSNAPFIGLFGTVLGIIEAFAFLSTEQAGSGVVMASISQALIATAAGLFVAIPAVVAFNIYSGKLRAIIAACESVKSLYLSRLAGKD